MSRINGDHIEAIRCAGKQRESCSDWQNASVPEGGSEFRPMDWQRIQKVFRVCSSQERFFVRLGRNRTSAVEWVRISCSPTPQTMVRISCFLFTVVGFSENQDRFLNDG